MGMGILRPTFQKKRKFPLAKPEEVVYNIIVARSGHADIAQQVERILGKDEVASSNLAISSRKSFIFEGFFFIYARFLQVLPFHPAKRRPHLLFRQKSVSCR